METSLLSTLGKLLGTRRSLRRGYHSLWKLMNCYRPTISARENRSAEQALLLLQENIYTAWRSRKVVSLVSFDVKGAYNGVCKDRLLERLSARGIPPCLVNWIDAFCSEHTASIVVNGWTSELSELE